MKVLIIGNGGREHALGYKIKQSKRITSLYFAPGNAGTATIGENICIKTDDVNLLKEFAIHEGIDITIVGPEVTLEKGIVEEFLKDGLKIFGPSKHSALLETSKAFSKKFMEKYEIPTAQYKVFEDYNTAIDALKEYTFPLVIKADGLASGKGVFICYSKEEACDALKKVMMDKIFLEAGNRVIIEEFLEGKEVSLLCFVDGKTILPMESASDYKKAHDNDLGLNTGGMGCISPSPYYRDDLGQDIIKKTLKGMQEENLNYSGIIYIGLILTKDGPKVLEYNVRFGDPETEVLMLRLETDLIDIIELAINRQLDTVDLIWKIGVAICVVVASYGYPENPIVGKEIKGIPNSTSDFVVFHAGTKFVLDKLVSSGGRVLVASAIGKTPESARSLVYKKIQEIQIENSFYRCDIGLTK